MSPDNAETQVSRPESDGFVTEPCDSVAGGSTSIRAVVDPPPTTLFALILWKINHILWEECDTCQTELRELLRDWRSQSESRLPLEAE